MENYTTTSAISISSDAKNNLATDIVQRAVVGLDVGYVG